LKRGFSTSINTYQQNKTQNSLRSKITHLKPNIFQAIDEKRKKNSNIIQREEEFCKQSPIYSSMMKGM
jgi:G:T/U-mismatch repair DNA glycosylase